MSWVEANETLAKDDLRISTASPKDYFALLKPRVMSLVIFTALAGMLTAPGRLNPIVGAISLLAIAIGAGAAGALNMWYEADIDAKMSRTRRRPIPAGKILPEEALGFGATLAAFSVITLGLVSGWMGASLLAFTIFFYVVIYTMWLKRWTPQNIVIGGAAGALPPVVAHAAATGSVDLFSLSLFAVIFFWTPPHFWALALVKSEDYAAAGVPMLPNVKGHDRTRLEILLYSLVLAPVGLAPYLLGGASRIYAAAAILGGAGMCWSAVRVYSIREGALANKAAMRLFGLSILYLFALFAILVAERAFALWSASGI